MSADSGSATAEDIAIQAALKGSVKTPEQIVAEIDGIQVGAVNAVSHSKVIKRTILICALFQIAKKVACQPLSIAAYGNLQSVPFLDEMKC